MRNFLLKFCLLFAVITHPFVASAQVMFPTDDTDDNNDFNKKRLRPVVYYSNPDRIYAGLKFVFARGRLGKNPYGYEQSVQLRYSISQNAYSALYDGNFYE